MSCVTINLPPVLTDHAFRCMKEPRLLLCNRDAKNLQILAPLFWDLTSSQHFGVPDSWMLKELLAVLREQSITRNVCIALLPCKDTVIHFSPSAETLEPLMLSTLQSSKWGKCPVISSPSQTESIAFVVLSCHRQESQLEIRVMDTNLPEQASCWLLFRTPSETQLVMWPLGEKTCRIQESILEHSLCSVQLIYPFVWKVEPSLLMQGLQSYLAVKLQGRATVCLVTSTWKRLPLQLPGYAFYYRLQNHTCLGAITHSVLQLFCPQTKKKPDPLHVLVRIVWRDIESDDKTIAVSWSLDQRLNLMHPTETVSVEMGFELPAAPAKEPLTDGSIFRKVVNCLGKPSDVQSGTWRPQCFSMKLETNLDRVIEVLKLFIVLRQKPKSRLLSVFEISFERLPSCRSVQVILEVQTCEGTMRRFVRVVDLSVHCRKNPGIWIPQSGLSAEILESLVPNSLRVVRLQALE